MKSFALALFISFSVQAFAAPIQGEVTWERYEKLVKRMSGVKQNLLLEIHSTLEINKTHPAHVFTSSERKLLEDSLGTYFLELLAMYTSEVRPSFHLRSDGTEEYFIRVAMKAYYYAEAVEMLNLLAESPSVIVLLESDFEPVNAQEFVPVLLQKLSNELQSKGPAGVPEIKQRGFMKSSPSLGTFVSYLNRLNRKLKQMEDLELRGKLAKELSRNLDRFFLVSDEFRFQGKRGFKNTGMARFIYGLRSNFLYVSGRIWVPKRYAIKEEVLKPLEKDFLPGDIALIRHDKKLTNIGLRGEWSHGVLYLGSPEKLDSFFNNDSETVTYYRDRCRMEGKICESFLGYLIKTYPEEMKTYLEKRNYKKERELPNVAIESRGDGVVFSDLYRALLKDQLAVFRPRLSLRARAQAIETAIQHYGKPYDFGFDLRTEDKMVCTELIYYGYSKRPDNNQLGIDWDVSVVMGKPNMYGEDIAKTFLRHFDAGKPQMDLILFIKPNPRTREYVPLGVEELRKTIHRAN